MQAQKVEWWLPGDRGKEEGRLLFNGTEFLLEIMKKFWYSGELYKIVSVLNATELCT